MRIDPARARRKGGNHTAMWAKSVPGREQSKYKTPERKHLAYWRNTKRPVQLEQNEWHGVMGDNYQRGRSRATAHRP